ncbi:hypothetical protein EVJ58_g1721 [Rhodofomes roseus]|uniref:F-box domain-containing protein n=1 Tax=Rhodofomes roseus TaxID=34475 RepID=A0A4Y9YZW3_9APHY|nr:hypothetical protein EVJ58_g1721 [Rhodofomes roseus]
MIIAAAAYAPLEICIDIFDRLEGDRQTLQSCALTCRAWLNAARLYLFRTAKLNKESIPGFRAILSHAPAIGFCVRVLHLNATAAQGFQLLRDLPNVKHLMLSGWILRHEVDDNLAACLNKLDTLELNDCNFTAAELPRILSACHGLSSLSLRDVTWPLLFGPRGRWPRFRDLSRDVLQIVPKSLLHVQNFSIIDCTMLVCELITRGKIFKQSPCLTLTHPETGVMQRLLTRWGPSIKDLKFIFADQRDTEKLPPDLDALTELVSLTIERRPLGDIKGLPIWLTRALKHVRSCDFRHLKVITGVGWHLETRREHWQPVLDALGDLAKRSGGVNFVFEARHTSDYYRGRASVPLKDLLEATLVRESPPGLTVEVVVHTDSKESPP